jgi:hypothetical protein
MSFAMLCPGGAEIFLLIPLAVVLLTALGGACVAAAIFVTVRLAKWAAARHNRMAATRGWSARRT